MRLSFPSIIRSTLPAFALLLASSPPAGAHFCWWYSMNTVAHNPLPWACGGQPPLAGGTATSGMDVQYIIGEHWNWHCTNPAACTVTYGNAFVAFHRQFILDFDLVRSGGGVADRIDVWEANQNSIMPGEDETTASEYAQCLDETDGPSAVTRAAGAICDECSDIPGSLTVAGIAIADGSGHMSLDQFSSLGEVGAWLECSGWHGDFHCGGADAGGASFCQDLTDACNDIGPMRNTARDPAFWMGHKMLDVLARDWERLQSTDLVVVMDKSGSMDDDCSDNDDDCLADDDGSPCKMNNAKSAIEMLGQLIRDNPGASDNKVGLVTFSSAATNALDDAGLASLLDASMLVANEGDPDTPFQTVVGDVGACGATSIGAGVELAQTILDAGSNPHKAILILSDGMENTAPLIEDLDIPPETQICAIGYGADFGDSEEGNLRQLCESHGGILLADPDLDGNGIDLQKFFVDAVASMFDEALSADPVLVMPALAVSTMPISTQVCGADSRLTIVLGREWGAAFGNCDLRLIVETPAGNMVDLDDPAIEHGHGKSWDFVRIPLPYKGERTGKWTAFGVRDQRVFVNGFTTDSPNPLSAGTALVRTQVHRLLPDGVPRCLYYEDGSPSGLSSYRTAVNAEATSGNIVTLVQAASAVDFNAKLAQQWDLIVFARQVAPAPQVYDAALQNKICQGQKAILTDFWNPSGGNPILRCAGTTAGTPLNWTTMVGDGRLWTGTIALMNTGYPVFSFTVTPSPGYILQGMNGVGGGSIVGSAAQCDVAQTYFTSTMVRGVGRVEPYSMRPTIGVGQKILATFRLNRAWRPLDGWDAVTAKVTLDRPGPAALQMYDLHDDGTSGDQLAGNNTWSVEIPDPVTSTGPHVLRATFTLTNDGCTITREAEYSIVVKPDPPGQCASITCMAPKHLAPSQVDSLPTFVTNRCTPAQSFTIKIADTRGWLCQRVGGGYVPVPSAMYTTPPIAGHTGRVLHELSPLFVCVPGAAVPGESTIVTFMATPVTGGQTAQCQTVVHVIAPVSVTSLPAPDFDVRAYTNGAGGSVRFALVLPEEAAVTLRVYDVRGRHIATLTQGEEMSASIDPHQHVHSNDGGPVEHTMDGATHILEWNGRAPSGERVPAGAYLFHVAAGRRAGWGSFVIVR